MKRTSRFQAPAMREIVRDPQLREYLKNVQNWHGYVRFLGLPDRRDNPDIAIDRLFVEPLVLERHVSAEDAPKQWGSGTESIFELLNTRKPLVVLGDPGSGKSTLLNYVVWLLCKPSSKAWMEKLDNWLLPIPMVLRELSLQNVTDFPKLLDAALAHPMSQPLRSVNYLHDMLAHGRVLLLLDGIDEVGDIAARKNLRRAVMDGFASFSECQWLLTSRIVGYDEAPFDKVEQETQQESTSLVDPFATGDSLESRVVTQSEEEEERTKERPTLKADQLATVRYMAPFDDSRIEAFARNWYSQREAAAIRARESAEHLVRAVHADEAILRLARTPNLLTMMALIHRIEATLPHGRALLYERIAEAYLESIDRFRGVYSGAYNLPQKRKWLARIGFEVQRRRSTSGEGNIPDGESQLLIQSEDVVAWVEEEINRATPEASGMSALDFLDMVGRRSGLFLPRGNGRYAFVHLSFQEYFAAVAMEHEVTSLDWARDKSTRLGLTRNTLQDFAKESTWFETFSFLFELLASEQDWYNDLMDTVFGKGFCQVVEPKTVNLGDDRQSLGRLLTRLVTNPLSGLPISKKIDAMNVAVQSAVRYSTLFDSFSSEVFRELLGEDEGWNTRVLNTICDQVRKQEAFLLDLSDTRISDISFLSTAKSLICLDLNTTHISDVQPLAKLKNLERLYMSDTKVIDITPLGGLRKLKSVYFSRTEVQDITVLSTATELEQLVMSNTPLSDISPLSSLFNLEYLSLTKVPISDLGPLTGLKKLKTLRVAGTNVADLSPLVDLVQLETLVLWGTKVSDIKPLSGMKLLKELDLDSTEIANLDPISCLSSLESLDIRSVPISDISPLSKLSSLRILKLWDTEVADLKPLQGLTSLMTLDLDGTRVSDLSPLKKLKNLRSLDLRNLDLADAQVEELSESIPDCFIVS